MGPGGPTWPLTPDTGSLAELLIWVGEAEVQNFPNIPPFAKIFFEGTGFVLGGKSRAPRGMVQFEFAKLGGGIGRVNPFGMIGLRWDVKKCQQNHAGAVRYLYLHLAAERLCGVLLFSPQPRRRPSRPGPQDPGYGHAPSRIFPAPYLLGFVPFQPRSTGSPCFPIFTEMARRDTLLSPGKIPQSYESAIGSRVDRTLPTTLSLATQVT